MPESELGVSDMKINLICFLLFPEHITKQDTSKQASTVSIMGPYKSGTEVGHILPEEKLELRYGEPKDIWGEILKEI